MDGPTTSASVPLLAILTPLLFFNLVRVCIANIFLEFFIPNFNSKIQWLTFYFLHGLWKKIRNSCPNNVEDMLFILFHPLTQKRFLKSSPTDAGLRVGSVQLWGQVMEPSPRCRGGERVWHLTEVKSCLQTGSLTSLSVSPSLKSDYLWWLHRVTENIKSYIVG